jgi:hypothetical protein
VETDVWAGSGAQGGLCDPGVGKSGQLISKSLLVWGDAIKVGEVGFSVFGIGLQRCDSV